MILQFAVGAVVGWLLRRPEPVAAAPPGSEVFGPFDVDGRQVTIEVAQVPRRIGSLKRGR